MLNLPCSVDDVHPSVGKLSGECHPRSLRQSLVKKTKTKNVAKIGFGHTFGTLFVQ